MLIAPSMLSSDFSTLGEETARMERAGADWIHLDVMDAHFVPNLTFGAPIVGAIRPYTKLPFDVHLMISEPLRYVDDFLKAGADIISFHLEAESSVRETIRAIRAGGAKPAVALKPKTPVEAVLPFLDDLDMVLVMTVEPGFGGQAFLEDQMPKLRQVRSLIEAHNPTCLLQVDGGIRYQTAQLCVENGANVLAAGSSFFRAPDATSFVESLHALGCVQ